MTDFFIVVGIFIVFVICFLADVGEDWLFFNWKPCVKVEPFVKWCRTAVAGGCTIGGRWSLSGEGDDFSDGVCDTWCVCCLEKVDPLDGGTATASGCWCNASLDKKDVWYAVFVFNLFNGW